MEPQSQNRSAKHTGPDGAIVSACNHAHPASAIALGDDDGDLDVLLRRSVVDDAFSAEDFRGNDLFVFENRGASELRHAGTHAFDEEDRP